MAVVGFIFVSLLSWLLTVFTCCFLCVLFQVLYSDDYLCFVCRYSLQHACNLCFPFYIDVSFQVIPSLRCQHISDFLVDLFIYFASHVMIPKLYLNDTKTVS
jgi:hypothetical protein